jgi:RHS repeat-associated protein
VIARAHHTIVLLLAVLLTALWPTPARAIRNDATASLTALRLEEKPDVRKIGILPETRLSAENQCVVAKAPTRSFDAFGRLIGKWGSMADVNRYRFSSKEYDTVTGLYYYGARFYDPTLQRFLNRDPIGELGGFNLYEAMGNNAVCYIDPWGFIWYDDLGNWVQNNAAISKNYINNNLSPGLAAAADTVLDLGAGLGSYPQALGHLGEGSGTFSADPSLANAAGLAQDIATASSTLATGLAQLPSARAPLFGNPETPTPKPAAKPCPPSKGSTANLSKGTTLPRNLREQMAAQQAAANPAAGTKLNLNMTDPRWPGSSGWQKMQQVIQPGGDPINVHYTYNPLTGEVDDLKIVLPGAR